MALAKRTSDWVAARTWLTVPGAASSPSAHSVWMESITTRSAGLPSASVARMLERLVSQASASGACSQAQPLGAQAHLRRGFLAGEIDGAPARRGEGGGHLQQQRRFADAGLAADQQCRARNDAAAGDAVELGEPGRHALELLGS